MKTLGPSLVCSLPAWSWRKGRARAARHINGSVVSGVHGASAGHGEKEEKPKRQKTGSLTVSPVGFVAKKNPKQTNQQPIK